MSFSRIVAFTAALHCDPSACEATVCDTTCKEGATSERLDALMCMDSRAATIKIVPKARVTPERLNALVINTGPVTRAASRLLRRLGLVGAVP